MAFFTRKGLTVPDFPSDNVLTEEPEEFNLPSTPSSLATPDDLTQPKSSGSGDIQKPISSVSTGSIDNEVAGPSRVETDEQQADQQQRFDYVVDRTYGVEV